MKYNRDAVLSASAVADNVNGIVLDASQLLCASFQATLTGDLGGNIHIQASNDTGQTTPISSEGVVNWSDIVSPVTVAGGSTYLIPKTDLSYRWIRVYFEYASGTGDLVVNAMVLGI